MSKSPSKARPSLKELAADLQPSGKRQLSGHFPAADVKAFRVLAAQLDMDVQELMAEAMNMVFIQYGKPTRVQVVSGRRKRPNKTPEA